MLNSVAIKSTTYCQHQNVLQSQNNQGPEQFSTTFQEKAEVTVSVQGSYKLAVIIRILQNQMFTNFFKKSAIRLKTPGVRNATQIIGVTL